MVTPAQESDGEYLGFGWESNLSTQLRCWNMCRTGHVQQPKRASNCITSIKISYNDNLSLNIRI